MAAILGAFATIGGVEYFGQGDEVALSYMAETSVQSILHARWNQAKYPSILQAIAEKQRLQSFTLNRHDRTEVATMKYPKSCASFRIPRQSAPR